MNEQDVCPWGLIDKWPYWHQCPSEKMSIPVVRSGKVPQRGKGPGSPRVIWPQRPTAKGRRALLNPRRLLWAISQKMTALHKVDIVK